MHTGFSVLTKNFTYREAITATEEFSAPVILLRLSFSQRNKVPKILQVLEQMHACNSFSYLSTCFQSFISVLNGRGKGKREIMGSPPTF